MNPETRDKLRAAAQRQNHCAKCGGTTRALTTEEKNRNEGCFADLDYVVCTACGDVKAKRTKRR